MPEISEVQSRATKSLTVGALIIAIVAGVVSGYAVISRPEESRGAAAQPGLVDRIRNGTTIQGGYGVYPPYSSQDPKSGEVRGFSVDLLEHIAESLNLEINWKRISWDTMSADLKRGHIDVIASPIFQTIPRAPEFQFSEPYGHFADGIAVVRKGENRFGKFQDLNRPGLEIAVGQGQASEALARTRLPKATIVPIAVGTDNMRIFNGVVTGRVDVAVADAANARRFVEEHKDAVKALWIDDPPATMPAGFAVRPNDIAGARFLSTAIRYMRSTGILKSLAKRYEFSNAEIAASGHRDGDHARWPNMYSRVALGRRAR